MDGVAVLVNDHQISDRADLDYFRKALRRLEVSFVFVQAKTSEHFDLGDILKFLSGVKAFFNERPLVKPSPRLQNYRELKDVLYGDMAIDLEPLPTCELFYVTTGSWQEPENARARIDAEIAEIFSSSLFSDVSFHPVDGRSLRDIYRGAARRVTKEIEFDRHTIIPNMTGVEEAYLGILEGREFLKLITDSDNKLQRSLFYDNVRDFQGNNSVNLDIEETLRKDESRDKFSIFNNGITIVAGAIRKRGSRFALSDFQIVNGCQTSHILHRNGCDLAGVYIPLKLIVANDADVIGRITKATNRQTEVKSEAFESLSSFHKELEEYYNACRRSRKVSVYYERRSRQYEGIEIQAAQIVTLTSQIKSFVGMFLNEPHSTHRYYGELLATKRDKLFQDTHSCASYYLSGFAATQIERLFADRKIRWELKPFKFHILMLVREIAAGPVPNLSDHRRIEAYVERIIKVFEDESLLHSYTEKISKSILTLLQRSEYKNGEAERLRSFTQELLAKTIGPGQSKDASNPTYEGKLVTWSDIKGYGFIKCPDFKADVYLHISKVQPDALERCVRGSLLKFHVVDGAKGQKVATEVRV